MTPGGHDVSLAGRDLITMSDLSVEEVHALLATAARMAEAIGLDDPATRQPVVRLDRIMATCFFEPSTRTRLSFESAMLRLGGSVLGFADPKASSAAKGETLADTARMVAAYADIIVIRHPKMGAAKVAAEQVGVAEMVDPRPHAVGTIRAMYEKYPHLGNVLPAMGYGDEQTRELQQTINATPCDAVLSATPENLADILTVDKPIVRAFYALTDAGEPTLRSVLEKNRTRLGG